MTFRYLIVVVILISASQQQIVYINLQTPFTASFILNCPVSLALPNFISDGRSLGSINPLDVRGDQPDGLYFQPNYEESLTKLTLYFNYMNIPTLPCQERLICEVAADPVAFYPVTTLILEELRQRNGPVDKSADSLMWRYVSAAREGFAVTVGQCGVRYKKCPLPANKMLNMPVIKVWQYLASKIGINLV